jgi:hypothetical protein
MSAPSVTIDDDTELGAACPSALETCPPDPASACRVFCQAAPNGCAEVWELHPLPQLEAGFSGSWRGVDPQGEHGLLSWAPPVDADGFEQTEYVTWSDAGVVSLSAALGSPPFFDIYDLSDDASAGIGAIGLDRIFWSRENGIEPLPLQNPSLARDGELVAGQAGNGGARWTPDAGRTAVFEFESARFWSYAEAGAALFVDAEQVIYSPRQGETLRVELPADAPPGATFNQGGLSASGEQFAVQVVNGTAGTLYLWADGVFQRIDLSAIEPTDGMPTSLSISPDGRVIVGVQRNFVAQSLFRWTAESGAVALDDDPEFYTWCVSPAGDVILGNVEDDEGNDVYMRWSVEDGMQATGAIEAPPGRLALEGDVLVEMDGAGPMVRKFGRALAETLPIEHLRGRLMPSAWHVPWLDRVTSNARVLAGSARMDSGNERLWLARLREVCPGKP